MADTEVETAPGEDNDDSWLYGDGPGELKEGSAPTIVEKDQPETGVDPDLTDEGKEKDQEDPENEGDENDDSHFNDEHFADVGREENDKPNGDAASQGHAESDSDDSDDVKVTIGDIKSGPQAYASLNIKRGVGLVAAGAGEKPRGPTPGKVTLEDLDGPGSINGVPALEFNIDTIEDKPWNKPGADISDYFNYGFNEVTWSAYCERQRRMRVNEAGVALLAGAPLRPPPPDAHRARLPGPPRNDDIMHSPMGNSYQARENTIQVMTAERREYGRAHPAPRDLAPPDYFGPPPDHYFPPPHTPYEEPWGHPEQSGWAPSDIKELTPGPMGPPAMGPPPPGIGPPGVGAHVPGHLMSAPYASPYRPHPPPHLLDRERERDRERDRDRERTRERDDRERRDRDRREDEERERDRERSRSIKPDRIREKSYRRDRSRSRSRRHKSRSRSPRLRERERDRERDRSRERERSRDRERSLKPKSKEPKEKEEEK